jgi:flagellar motor switch/type III secretory pathway protein FliN
LPDDFRALPTADVADWLRQGGTHDAAAVVKLRLAINDQAGAAYLIWPLLNLDKVKAAAKPAILRPPADQSPSADVIGGPERSDDSSFAGGAPTEASHVAAASEEPSVGSLYSGETFARSAPHPEGGASQAAKRFGLPVPTLHDLPPYTRSLLKIRVPLSVTLAAKKQPVGQILEIGPGSIVQFDKSCEEMLDLNVSNLPIARGEAVKVGDKFGLRVTSLILPGERFKPVRPGG